MNNTASSGSSILIYHTPNTKIKLKSFSGVKIQDDYGDVGIVRYLGE